MDGASCGDIPASTSPFTVNVIIVRAVSEPCRRWAVAAMINHQDCVFTTWCSESGEFSVAVCYEACKCTLCAGGTSLICISFARSGRVARRRIDRGRYYRQFALNSGAVYGSLAQTGGILSSLKSEPDSTNQRVTVFEVCSRWYQVCHGCHELKELNLDGYCETKNSGSSACAQAPTVLTP